MNRILIAAVVCAIALSGCAAQDQTKTKRPVPTEPAAAATPALTPAPTEAPIFAFEGRLNADAPPLQFEVYDNGLVENIMDHWTTTTYYYDIRVSSDAIPGFSPQTIEIESNVPWNAADRAAYVDLVDIDFDGWADLQIALDQEDGNTDYIYDRWIASETDGYGEFDIYPFFQMRTASYELLPAYKQIINTLSGEDPAMHNNELYQPYDGSPWLPLFRARELYQLFDMQPEVWPGGYKLVRWETREPTQTEGVGEQLWVRTFSDMETQIFSEVVPYPAGEFVPSETSTHWLRFGTEQTL